MSIVIPKASINVWSGITTTLRRNNYILLQLLGSTSVVMVIKLSHNPMINNQNEQDIYCFNIYFELKYLFNIMNKFTRINIKFILSIFDVIFIILWDFMIKMSNLQMFCRISSPDLNFAQNIKII